MRTYPYVRFKGRAEEADDGKRKPSRWPTDKFGVYWQVAPKVIIKRITDPDRTKAQTAMQAMMTRIVITDLENAFGG